ncbi:hypothetical protein ABW20_dc0104403 [Dactylellina cionopaga]|nr:hypothetical protein ABW20_dc0104403 [Dactylellina cionopaga]
MGNTQSAQDPRHGRSSHSHHTSSTASGKVAPSPSKSSPSKKTRRLTKPKVGGETPTPIALPASLSRRNSKSSIRNAAPNLPDRLNSMDGGSIPYPRPPTRTGSIDLGRRNSNTSPGNWSSHPSQKPSREALNSSAPTSFNLGRTPSHGAIYLERRRSLIHEPFSSPTSSPPPSAMSPVLYIRPMTAPAAENNANNNNPYLFAMSSPLDSEDHPPTTASSTDSFHSALQSPTRMQHTPSPTKFMQQNHQPPMVFSPEPSYHEPSYQVPVRRRSLLQAAAPGTATRPKAPQEPEPEDDMMATDEDMIYIPPPRILALNRDETRPETPQDQGTLGGLKKGSLFVANGAASPSPSSPSLRAVSGGSQRYSSLFSLAPVSPGGNSKSTFNETPVPASPPQTPTRERQRYSSLLSQPPLPIVDNSNPAAVDTPPQPAAVVSSEPAAVETPQQKVEEALITASPKTPTKAGSSHAIPRKPIASPSSPRSAKRLSVQVVGQRLVYETIGVDTSVMNTARHSLRIVPPSPDAEAPSTEFPIAKEAPTIQPSTEVDASGVSPDEDPHRRHLFGYGLRNKQFLNGEYQQSPSSDYSQTTASANPSANPSAKPGLDRSPFSYEGAKLVHPTNIYATEVEGGERAVEPISELTGMDALELEEVKSQPLVVKSTPQDVTSTEIPVESSIPEPVNSAEEKPPSSPDASDVSDQSQTKQSGVDSGYSSAESATLPQQKGWKRSKNRQSAPENLANDFNNEYPEMRPSTSHGATQELKIATSVLTVPYAAVRNRTPPTLEAPPRPKTPKNKGRHIPIIVPEVLPTPTPPPASRIENEVMEDVNADEVAEKKLKKKRRLSWKRLSFRGDKRPEIEAPVIASTPEPSNIIRTEIEAPAIDDTIARSPVSPPRLNLGGSVRPEETQYQEQPQPEKYQSFTSSIRSGLQSIGYSEAASISSSPIDPPSKPPSEYHEPMAITSSTPTRAVMALRSSESVSYTGAAYYQRFNTPSPTGGPPITPVVQQQTTPPPMPPMPPQPVTLERQASLPRHTTPPSSYKPPPGKYPTEDNSKQPSVRRRPLGNTAIKSPSSPIPPNPQVPVVQPSTGSAGSSSRVSRTNSLNSQFSYNTQSGFYQTSQKSESRTGRSKAVNPAPQPAHSGVLPFATGPPPLRRRRSSSSGSVGPGGYPHLGKDTSSDKAVFGLDFRDVPIRRANDLVQNYGSTGGAAGGGEGYTYSRKRSSELPNTFKVLYGEKQTSAAEVRFAGEEEEGGRGRVPKKAGFWKKAAAITRGRSRSKSRTRGEVVGY